MKLIFLGDSLTEGTYGGDYVAHIRALRPDDVCINAGVGGDTVVNIAGRLDALIAQQPDGVFLMVGANDAISYAQPETRVYYKTKNLADGFVSPDTFAQTYRDVLTRLQTAHIPTWIGLAPIEYNPITVQTMREYNALVMQIARPMNIPILDLMPHFTPSTIPDRPALGLQTINTIGKHQETGWSAYDEAQAEGGYTYTFDGIHLTEKSAVQFADLIHQFIGDNT